MNHLPVRREELTPDARKSSEIAPLSAGSFPLFPTAPLTPPATTTTTTTTLPADTSTAKTKPATEPKTEDPGFFWGASLVDPLKLWW